MNKKVKGFIHILILTAVLGFAGYFFNSAEAATTDSVSGYAWSENIGWISFNCTDRDVCATSNYGVNIEASGAFSGYAWSENIGWINLAPAGPYPDAPNNSAEYNSGSGEVRGWARAESNGNGWDGWILFGQPSGWIDQVSIESGTGEFAGWAWGGGDAAGVSGVIGWISFNCKDRGVCATSDYKVIADINEDPSVDCDDSETWTYCSDSRNPTLSWDYSDPESDPQESYQIQVDDNSNFSSPEIDTGEVFSSGNSYRPTGTTLDWNTTYYWRVKVKDNLGHWSDWSSPDCDFDVPLHAYPDPDFTWSPANPSALEEVQFTDQTTFYNGGSNWSWTFESAVPASSVLQNPVATFSAQGNWEVVLEATDSDGYMCPASKTVDVEEELPEWKEVIPN